MSEKLVITVIGISALLGISLALVNPIPVDKNPDNTIYGVVQNTDTGEKATALVLTTDAESSYSCSEADIIDASMSEDKGDWHVEDLTGQIWIEDRFEKDKRIQFCVKDKTVGIDSIGLVGLGTTTYNDLVRELNSNDKVVFENPHAKYKLTVYGVH